MSDTVKIRVRASAFSNISYDLDETIDSEMTPEEWAELSEEERLDLMQEWAEEALWEDISLSYGAVED